MRDFKGIKRQRNRNRNGGGGGGKPQHNANRAFDSNGPDGIKVRGAAQHVYEKYQQLARDAHTAGDRVLAENHLQHAEHYFRVMRAMQPQRPLSDIIGRDQFVSGYDIDFEDESGAQAETAEADSEPGDGEADRPDQRQGDDRGYRDARPREEWRGEDRGQNSGGDRPDRQFRGPRDDRFRDDRPRPGGRDDRPRFERQDRGERPDRDRQERDRQERERQERGDPRHSSPYRSEAQDYRPPVSAVDTDLSAAPVLRADDGDVSHAPAFLQTRTPEVREEPAGEARLPPRRRGPRDMAESAPDPAEGDDS